MSGEPNSNPQRWREPGVAYYILMCLVSLAAIFLVLVQRDFGAWALLPVLAGLIGGATRFGPALFLLALGVSFTTIAPGAGSPMPPVFFDIRDLVLCGAVLAYVIGHYRVQAMLLRVFPPDSRQRAQPAARGRKRRPTPARRSPSLVSQQEIGVAVLILPIFGALAQFLWNGVRFAGANPGLQPPIWHGIVLSWVIGLAWLTAAGLIGYDRRRRMTEAEATLYLQDILWAETRREQRRVNRWLAWAWLRHQQHEEQP